GTSSIAVGYERYLFHRTVCFEEISQLGFGCAVGQIPNIKVLHRNSSFGKSKLVGVAVGFASRPSESRGGGGRGLLAFLRDSGAGCGDSTRSFENAPPLRRIPRIDIAFRITNGSLFVPILRCQFFVRIRRTREILWLANQEGQSLRGCRGAKVVTKLVALALSLFHIDQHEVVQARSPP